ETEWRARTSASSSPWRYEKARSAIAEKRGQLAPAPFAVVGHAIEDPVGRVVEHRLVCMHEGEIDALPERTSQGGLEVPDPLRIAATHGKRIGKRPGGGNLARAVARPTPAKARNGECFTVSLQPRGVAQSCTQAADAP